MSLIPRTIPKQPSLKPAEDFYRLRREGIGFIEQLGSRFWTDYNTHDPGITILEALIYAITDLAYRLGWEIKDILAPASPSADPRQPFPDQPFYTARDILTVSPWTPDDFRRLLIDLDLVRNAWVMCKSCACDVLYYAWCEFGELKLSYQPPNKPNTPFNKVQPLGLYQVLLELESDPELGDLNERKIEHQFLVIDPDDTTYPVKMELRFPAWQLTAYLGTSFDLTVSRFGAAKNYDVLTDPDLDKAGRDKYVREHWRSVFYVSFALKIPGGEGKTEKITIANVALRLFGDSFVRTKTFAIKLPNGEIITIENAALSLSGDILEEKKTIVDGLLAILEDNSPNGFVQRYLVKLLKREEAVTQAKSALRQNRNLDEDFCRVRVVEVESVAVCADVEVAPEADMELVQAQIWFELEQYFNPPVPFYTLPELVDAGVPVEDIFNGPRLTNGFIRSEDLTAANLKTLLRTSDIINRLMDIPGVLAVNNLVLSKYDSEGKVVKGAADPAWVNAQPLFDPNKTSAAWLLFFTPGHQPRFYANQSGFLFYKNGLPFLPRWDEANDALIQLRGRTERPKIKNASPDQLDLPIQPGTFRNPAEYFPLQSSFPLTYGIGPEALPLRASARRRAQARQLKAYLLVFEQLLANAFAQIANTDQLFSLNNDVQRTYFVRELSDDIIQGYADLMKSSFSVSALDKMAETVPEFLERRNRFLDHVLARFGAKFTEYALLLTNLQGQQVALPRLIEDKISFLKAYPSVSHDRGRAFNHKEDPWAPKNISGLKKRLSLLLGYPDLTFATDPVVSSEADNYQVTYRLQDRHRKIWLGGNIIVTSSSPDTVVSLAFQKILRQMVETGSYEISLEAKKFRIKLRDDNGDLLGQHPESFLTLADTEALRDELLGWSANERAIVVEHLLLRPKFPGDALYPACSDGPCKTCGDEDPYSFQLTFVMPGWSGPFNTKPDLRDFADRTIRQETPAHLLAKICWVGNDGFEKNPCAPIVNDLVELLQTKGQTSEGQKPVHTEACTCADAIYTAFSQVFENWYKDKNLVYIQPEVLQAILKKEFNAKVDPGKISCPTVLEPLWADVQAMLVEHFQHLALYGLQFDRFETAWRQWLEEDAVFDWTTEQLHERLEAILQSNVQSAALTITKHQDALCRCAADILAKYGTAFYNWMADNFNAGTALEDLPAFQPDIDFGRTVPLCPGFTFTEAAAVDVKTLIHDRYNEYTRVSYRLWVVVNLLSQLRSTYPVATLHDFDAGSDQNPVRLGKTALGSR